ncbi:hypothetical protein ONE63_009459 [Megalurothrips usitatus]|uniref:TRAFD1/XAF1 zinc finger domain-containing protein n=1 Tax=Megalurothrips usitatus TaxID=439358 RepID=A0AAV7XM84_9NEOP|nr:hypothetical protein ONE63_009459 [Megalurothrips usitatus]
MILSSQRPIAASNFVTHSVHCQRNLTKCEKCGEAVPRSSMEEHEAEFHVKVNCPDCRVSVEKPLLDAHKKTSCRSRQQGCPYCELDLPASEMYEHKNYCGSRTKKCEDCGEYVMLKYEQLHLESNHGFLKLDDEPGPTATWIKNDLESANSRSAKSNNNKKPQLNTGKFDNSDDDDVEEIPNLFANLMKKKKVVGTTPLYPGVAYPLSGGPQRVVSRSPPPYQDVPDESSDLVALPCEFCEAMIPVNQLILHQTACRMDITSLGKQTKKVETGKLKPNFAAYPNDKGTDFVVEENNFESNAYDDVLDWRREENPELFDIRRNAIDEGTVDVRRNDLTGTSYDVYRNSIGGTETFRQDSDDADVYLPCEFCSDGYPPSLLLEHQNVCEYHPKNVPDGAAHAWSDPQEGAAGRPSGILEALRARKFDVKDSDQHSNGSISILGARGKSNIDSYNDLRGNFTVASEWSDDSDSRPTSATGAIPKQKAGKPSFPRVYFV